MRLEELNSKYDAFITIDEIKGRDKGKLKGLTFGIKDIILTKGIKTTAGSKILKDYIPNRNAWIVDKILEEGGTIVGKTNTHEFAIGATNTSSIAGPARNPYDPERISGGSSGGSAVAVALKMVDVGVGTDTGGSIRIPASLCGVIGFKPTTGIIPIDGVIPFSWTLDTIGFITRDIPTLRRVLDAVIPIENKHVLVSKVRTRPRLGVFLFKDDPASNSLKSILNKLSSYFDLIDLRLNFLEGFGSNVRGTIALAEGSSYHRDWIESTPGMYFPDVKELLMQGLQIRAIDYIDALRARRVIFEEYVRAFDSVDAIISPTTKIPAPKISEVVGREKEYRKLLVSNTELFNLVNAPSISLPVSKVNDLPIGLMVSGLPYEDGIILDIAEKILELAK
ncbi:aspartyl/glutamyl-tRNA amidotransferase subunit A, GatA [Acidianus hospitalis W1]|uniref:Aspartyl/glutamyl-tRNA amidotransferase subunit A, GatA n=1 Tax=Acidianus hospitalis (strain W1) TaxID=933801 RepID=F4B9U0_ACIHW|nr:amidase [Acidianus hospitalis]AEE95156.1 aspartyl/glutamyl-tRNA amidotransferase subunit A, GatA [Acidianus hospitalis W1]